MKTIFDTADRNFEYADYLEYCEINGREPMGEDSADFFMFCLDSAWDNVECDWENIKYTKADKELMPFYVEGHLGLWYGSPRVHSTAISWGISAAIRIAIKGCDDYKVWYDEGRGIVRVEGYHHDGCNCFDIHLLSSKGRERVQNAINSGEIQDDFLPRQYCYKRIKESDLFW